MVHVEDENSIVLIGLQDGSRGAVITEKDLKEVFLSDILSSVVNPIGIIDICIIYILLNA